jgi:hypothetical protein
MAAIDRLFAQICWNNMHQQIPTVRKNRFLENLDDLSQQLKTFHDRSDWMEIRVGFGCGTPPRNGEIRFTARQLIM